MPLQTTPTASKPDEIALLTPEEFRALAACVQKKANHIKFSRQLVINTTLIALGIFSLGWLWSGSAAYVLAAFSLLFIYLLANQQMFRRTCKNEEEVKRLAEFVENTREVRHLGTILELHEVVRRSGVAWFELFTAVYQTIPRLLPFVQSQHIDALNTPQRACLRRGLFHPGISSDIGYWRGPEYCLEVLSALEQIGDKRDLPDVEQLLKTHNIPDEIRAAAERCVEVIRERVAREEGKDFLLRADRKPDAVATLLRPSIEHADTPPQQLLRAAVSDDRDTPA
jgi:hypothetical protein